jgi:hypothetical protein
MKFSSSPYSIESCICIEVGYKSLTFFVKHDALVKLTEDFVFDKLCERIYYIQLNSNLIRLFINNYRDEKEMIHELSLSVDDYNTLKGLFETFNDTYDTDDIREILTYLCKK